MKGEETDLNIYSKLFCDGPGCLVVTSRSAETEDSVAPGPRDSCPLSALPAATSSTRLQIPLLCRRLLSIRGVNDVLLSKGFLKSSLSSTHTRCTQRQGDEGEEGERGLWYFPTQGTCHEVSIEFRFYRFTCPFVNHGREEVLIKPLAQPLQFPFSTQRDLRMSLIEENRKRNGEEECGDGY